MARRTTIERFTPTSTKRRGRRVVGVVAFDGVVLGDLATPCEVFGRLRDVEGRAVYEVRVCSEKRRIRSEHVGLDVRWRLSSLDRAATVIVPGIESLDGSIPAPVQAAIRRAVRRGACVASICTGAFVLASAGVLDGLRATTHWVSAPELERRYPRVRVDPDVLYVDNGQVLTSAGAAAGLDLCLHLVRRELGGEAAARAARAAVMPLERAGGQAQFIEHEPPEDRGTPIGALLEWVERNLDKDLAIHAVARRAHMSTRTFCRRFRAQVGATPAVWIARARVSRAQRLLETTELSVERVAEAVGFRSGAVLRDQFARILGTSPRAYRGAFPPSRGFR